MVEKASNRERAIELRKNGLSRSQIAAALGLKTGGRALSEWLRDVPPPEWTRRPRAKDDLRQQAVELRREGKSYRQILEAIPVSKSSLSLWLREIPMTTEQRTRLRDLQVANGRTRGQSNRARRLAADFAPTTLKKAKVNPQRHYLGDDYHGCLVVNVARPTDLYRQIAGWWAGIVGQLQSGVV